MKHFCVLCWTKWNIPNEKRSKYNHYLTMCDPCLISMYLKQIKYLPPLTLFRRRRR